MKAHRQSPTALAAHLSCSHLTQLERQRRAGDLKIDFRADPRLEGLQERGRRHEAAYIIRLKDAGRTIKDLTESRNPEDTLAAMREGYGAIVQAPVGNDAFFGIADVLLRCEVPSALGDYSYEPVDTKLSRETRASTILQLVTYCDLLGAAQARDPEHFYVVTPSPPTPLPRERGAAQVRLPRDRGGHVETYRLADFGAFHRFVRERFQAAIAETPPPATYPEPVSHCDVCRYWPYCDKRRRADDYPSLIAGIHEAHVREFQSQGIGTVAAIGAADGNLPNVPRRGRKETYAALGQQARLQVLARTQSPPPLEYLPIDPARGFARLPEPSPGDIFLDFEGDPFVGESGLEYLTGYHWRDANGKLQLKQDWAFDAIEEKAACARFIDFATTRWAAHPGMHIYHFGAYEPATLKRLCARYETRGEELDRFLRGGRFIDLHTVVREAMRIGVERYGLKELEALHNFTRKRDLADAGIARRDVELALELGDADAITQELRACVAEYNAEDCLSTEALRAWLEAGRATVIAEGKTIDRPPDQSPEASEAVSERDLRIQALKDALMARVPEDSAVWSEEDRAIALLASMLGYFRQEEKNAYWEHFRLRDLPPEERMDEREMLAGLEYVETVPKVGKQKSERRLYRFRPQEHTIKKGDDVYFTLHEDPAGLDAKGKGTSLKVDEIDVEESTILLSSSRFVPGQHPTAVFAEQVVGNVKSLERVLLAFAERVRDHGFETPESFAAASALLLRKRPGAGGSGAALRAPDEDILVAAKRLSASLDGEVLPIQGPPGSGKTYTGARAILELVRQGKRVGVTAVSHKVIDNLLSEIREAAEKEDTVVRLLHKHNEAPPAGIEYTDKAGEALAAISRGTVVGGTVWLWANDNAAGCLDYLFIDEAGQMSLAHAFAASRAARNLVLLGDPQQLEQPQRGAHPEGADVAALVHVIGKERKTLDDDQGLFLDRTYRLHPAICAMTSELYYDGRLQPSPGLDRQQVGGDTPFAGGGLFLVQIPHEGNQAVSREEVDAVARIATSLLEKGIMWTDRDGNTRPLQPSDLLVVAPYNAQVAALRERLAALGIDRVGTVDKFQGQEAPVVIYSCTSSSADDAPRGMAFLYDPHRFNVATSRAQAVVIVVANPRLFEHARADALGEWLMQI
jgi:uncharacterized protein